MRWAGAVVLGVVTGAAACGAPEVADVTPGIYSLEVTAVTDDCDPPRATGRFEAAIELRSCEELEAAEAVPEGECDECGGLDCGADEFCDGLFPCRDGRLVTTGLAVSVPLGTLIPSLVPFELDPDLSRRVDLELGECMAGSLQRRLSVSSASREMVTATLVDTFAGLGACPEGGSFAVPADNCQSVRMLRYQLRSACEPPRVVEPTGATADFRCVRP